jgi:hypothetical protein
MKRLAYIAFCLMALVSLGGCGNYYYVAVYPESQFDHANQ